MQDACKKRFFLLDWGEKICPGLPPYKEHGNHRKTYMVTYEKIKVKESALEV